MQTLTNSPVTALKSQVLVQTSTLLAAPSTRRLVASDRRLSARAAAQQAHHQQCLYRVCAGLTAFRARDPDPHAVDGGAILGLRIEVVSRAKFLRPYYVLLNRPYPGGTRGGGKGYLRVHRHTVPACIPLVGLAARHLPPPAPPVGDGKVKGGRKQDLAKFARALRREVVRYHHRLGAVADLRKAAGLGKGAEERDGEGEEAEARARKLVGITAADAEAKQISIEWADGKTGRLVMSDDGDILKVVAVGESGRDREAVRQLLGGMTRVEDVAKRLAST